MYQEVGGEGLELFRYGAYWYVGPSGASCTCIGIGKYYAFRFSSSGLQPCPPDDDTAYGVRREKDGSCHNPRCEIDNCYIWSNNLAIAAGEGGGR